MDQTITIENSDNLKSKWYQQVTVEPTMFLYMMAFTLTNVVEQTFYTYQACRGNNGYSEHICRNLNEHPEENNQVQLTASTFHQWNGIANSVPLIIMAFFIGAWSDKRGRKAIILAGLIGKTLFSIMTVVNTLRSTWPVEYMVYTAALPSALTGGDMAIFAGCYSYVSDITSEKNRTFRIGILNVISLSSLPIGTALGSYLYSEVFNESFTVMFSINATLMILATLYSALSLDWQTSSKQKSLKEAEVKNPFTDFFDINHFKNTLVTLFKRRKNFRRLYLWLLLLSMGLYTFQRDQRPYMYLYTLKVFGWGNPEFSNFRTFSTASYVIIMWIGIPLMTKTLKWKDTAIIMIGSFSHIAGHLVYALARAPLWFYAGAVVSSLGPCIAPLIRSLTSKVLDTSERGVAFASLSVMEYATSFISAVIYSQIYNATLSWDYPNAIFFFTMGTMLIIFIFAIIIQLTLTTGNLEQEKMEIQNVCDDNEENIHLK